MKKTTPQLSVLLPLALDMTASLSSGDRLRRLVDVVRRALPCDSAALLRLQGTALVPVACFGLSEDIYGRKFPRAEHPRLNILCGSDRPVRFPADSPLPDPYDGLVLAGAVTLDGHVHSCLGCPLVVEGELIGVLTADALQPGAFDGISDEFLSHLAALAAASLRTNELMEELHRRAEYQGQVTRDLVRDAMTRRGSTLIGGSPVMARLRDD
ncbi:MAG TPA: GAF domain-containing protein, partial [Planctomycetota bacterium]|nr:GAF domain-containing protein [Planctomycetota bacterium]